MKLSIVVPVYNEKRQLAEKDSIAALFHLIRFNCFVSAAEAFSDLPSRYQPDLGSSSITNKVE